MSQPPLERVRQLVADIFNLPQSRIEPSSSPDTIEGWDSLQHLNLTLALEHEFGVQFTPEEINQLLSVELIADLLDEKLAKSL